MSFRKKIILISVGIVVVAALVLALIYKPLGMASSARLNRLSVASSSSQVVPGQTALVTATVVTRFGYPISGINIGFSTTLGTLSPTVAVTNASGQAKTYFSSAQTGVAQINARYGGMNAYTNITVAASPTTIFSDDFSGTLAKWQIVYNGYGTIAITNGQLSMTPKASTTPSETHAALVVPASWDSTKNDYIFNVKMNTVSQLRTGSSANLWEVGWILFRYQDAQHFYYFIPKPNGIELGKFVNGTQTFLATADTPKLTLNHLDVYTVTLKSNNIKVAINGTLVANYIDTNSPFLTGKIGLYDEDAKVLFDDVVVTTN
jgi:hypothetical protein